MNVVSNLRKLRACWRSIDLNFSDADVEAFAAVCYQQCTDWFGQPIDPQRPYRLILAETAKMSRFLLPYYIISLPGSNTSFEEYALCVAHEMYHRVTVMRKGLINTYWVDEMMAELTSIQILRNTRFMAYANRYYDAMVASGPRLDPQTLPRKVRYANPITLGYEIVVPDGFMATIHHLGWQLTSMVGWHHMIRIPECYTWQQWISELPPDVREHVCNLLREELS